jgi:arylsulfatase A
MVLICCCTSKEPQPPNIIFILADDLGYGDLKCYNPNSKILTPNIDKLALQGIKFTDAHSPSGVCSPSRYALLTGRYAWRNNRLKKGVIGDLDFPVIEEERLTVADLLREKGYRTASIGKWHLGHIWHMKYNHEPYTMENIDWSKPRLSGALQQGFDYTFGLGKPGWTFMENDKVLEEPVVPFDLSHIGIELMGHANIKGKKSPNYEHEKMLPSFTAKAVDFIKKSTNSDQPFFLLWTPMSPHKPVVPNKAFQGLSKAGLYGDFVSELDASVGQILDAIKKTGQEENTLIIVSSDNGPEETAYQRILKTGHYSMNGFRGVKRDLWEGGHRVPFIAKWPKKIQANSVSHEIICLTDFISTAAAISGYKLPDSAAEDSYNILSALLGEKLKNPIREATVHQSRDGKLAIRQEEWVYIDAKSGDSSGEPQWFKKMRGAKEHDETAELFNIKDDVMETVNRINEHPEKAEELKSLLKKYKNEGRSRP